MTSLDERIALSPTLKSTLATYAYVLDNKEIHHLKTLKRATSPYSEISVFLLLVLERLQSQGLLATDTVLCFDGLSRQLSFETVVAEKEVITWEGLSEASFHQMSSHQPRRFHLGVLGLIFLVLMLFLLCWLLFTGSVTWWHL